MADVDESGVPGTWQVVSADDIGARPGARGEVHPARVRGARRRRPRVGAHRGHVSARGRRPRRAYAGGRDQARDVVDPGAARDVVGGRRLACRGPRAARARPRPRGEGEGPRRPGRARARRRRRARDQRLDAAPAGGCVRGIGRGAGGAGLVAVAARRRARGPQRPRRRPRGRSVGALGPEPCARRAAASAATRRQPRLGEVLACPRRSPSPRAWPSSRGRHRRRDDRHDDADNGAVRASSGRTVVVCPLLAYGSSRGCLDAGRICADRVRRAARRCRRRPRRPAGDRSRARWSRTAR